LVPLSTFNAWVRSISCGMMRSRHIAHQHRHADRHAALAGRAVGRANQGVDRLVNVGVGHHHHVVFRATQGLHAFAVVSAGFVDVVAQSGWSRRS
jgi:hypothetical protein